MHLPVNFKSTIKSVFYDKTVAIFGSSVVTDGAGWAKKSEGTQTGTFLGNVNFAKLDKVQKEYGISEAIDILITTDQAIVLETLIGYGGIVYKVMRAIPFDSHYLLMGQKWLSKSST